jgi:hypothetical protein
MSMKRPALNSPIAEPTRRRRSSAAIADGVGEAVVRVARDVNIVFHLVSHGI